MLRRVLRYGEKMFHLSDFLASIRDRRLFPRYSGSVLVGGAFLMVLSRLRSLNALEQTRGHAFWKRWLKSPLPSADTIGRGFSVIDDAPLREGLFQIYAKARRSKMILPWVQGLFGLILDGHESSSSTKRCCRGCLSRVHHTKNGDRTEYYHRNVTALLKGKNVNLLLDTEPQQPGEDEVKAATRLFQRLLKRLPRAFDIVVADALYARAGFFKEVLNAGKEIIAVLKDDRRDLFKDAQGLFATVPPSLEYAEGGVERKVWDVEHLTTWESFGTDVRVVRSLEQRTVKRQLTGEREVCLSDWMWVTTLSKHQATTQTIVQCGHGRWAIENEGFNELGNRWYINHVYKHDPVAIHAFWLLTFWAYNLFTFFIQRNLKAALRFRHTALYFADLLRTHCYIALSMKKGVRWALPP